MYNKQGAAYHWVPELLNLPVYDGLQEQLELLRKEMLDKEKTEVKKRWRIELKKERTKDAQRRKEW